MNYELVKTILTFIKSFFSRKKQLPVYVVIVNTAYGKIEITSFNKLALEEYIKDVYGMRNHMCSEVYIK